MQLPPCGFYRTSAPIGPIPSGRLVYFHNHGDPGPGLYLPASWKANRVELEPRGTLLPSPDDVRLLEPLPAEGFYRVVEAFDCCEKRCRRFEPDTLVQLGYDAGANAILFVPELIDGSLVMPEHGSRIESEHFKHIKQLRVASPEQRPGLMH